MLILNDMCLVIKELDEAYEVFYKKERTICKRRNIKHLRNRRFECTFKVLQVEAFDVYCYIKHNSKHCWATLAVSEVNKKYTLITVFG